MAGNVGDKAMQGEWEEILVCVFEIKECMIMEFEGVSCNILDEEGKQQAGPFNEENGLVKQEVRSGDQCFVLKARIKFERSVSR
ncbi:hypothetical protein P175DRAFT_0501702 [Aspergillus ochraceoroseus IBT 24754]|uniref:Uncharacterized protein n=1 Tax=Aspergillus ochraceoroseus IBT 24754 TaxID=1392256 RepID=A0A2T5LXR0_9EURO|nr:uncharacterized protein P175DRAFT_0501702 [Aspergillus ochraceoroseus IBT 24754]PTU21072.1 hypothetical protein P175DRAFT_0501702 [Aspergillus ochraceoroseus IBT 24754]